MKGSPYRAKKVRLMSMNDVVSEITPVSSPLKRSGTETVLRSKVKGVADGWVWKEPKKSFFTGTSTYQKRFLVFDSVNLTLTTYKSEFDAQKKIGEVESFVLDGTATVVRPSKDSKAAKYGS